MSLYWLKADHKAKQAKLEKEVISDALLLEVARRPSTAQL